MERPPLAVAIAPIGNAGQTFVVMCSDIHPPRAPQELQVVEEEFRKAKEALGVPRGVVMGSLEVGCDFVPSDVMAQLTFRKDSAYSWLIPDSSDTTVTSFTTCALDRIIVDTPHMSALIVPGSSRVETAVEPTYNYDNNPSLDQRYIVETQVDLGLWYPVATPTTLPPTPPPTTTSPPITTTPSPPTTTPSPTVPTPEPISVTPPPTTSKPPPTPSPTPVGGILGPTWPRMHIIFGVGGTAIQEDTLFAEIRLLARIPAASIATLRILSSSEDSQVIEKYIVFENCAESEAALYSIRVATSIPQTFIATYNVKSLTVIDSVGQQITLPPTSPPTTKPTPSAMASTPVPPPTSDFEFNPETIGLLCAIGVLFVSSVIMTVLALQLSLQPVIDAAISPRNAQQNQQRRRSSLRRRQSFLSLDRYPLRPNDVLTEQDKIKPSPNVMLSMEGPGSPVFVTKRTPPPSVAPSSVTSKTKGKKKSSPAAPSPEATAEEKYKSEDKNFRRRGSVLQTNPMSDFLEGGGDGKHPLKQGTKPTGARRTYVVAGGRGVEGQLGLGPMLAVQEALVVNTTLTFAAQKSPPIRTQVGGYHSFVLLKDHTLLGFGDNSQGQVGVGIEAGPIVSVPTKIQLQKGSNDLRVTDMCCGEYHSVVLTNKGVFVFGSNSDGQLGLGERTPHSFKPVLLERNVTSRKFHVRTIHCGAYHTIFSTNENELFAMGSNECGQLLLGDTDNRYIPAKLDDPAFRDLGAGSALISIGCGVNHSVVITSTGVYAGGDSAQGQLGIGERGRGMCVVRPARVHYFDTLLQELRGVSAWFHTVFWTDTKLFVCGEGTKGKLGLGDASEDDEWSPVPVPYFENERHAIIKAIACAEHTVVLTETQVIAWGMPAPGVLGIDTMFERYNPYVPMEVEVAPLTQEGKTFVVDVGSALTHTLIVAEDVKVM
eukprot:PhF_6_TR25456/c0_g1_i1/m.35226/K19607/RPGR; X-linked retinitis pigmentosa GTPase regulator